nr:putative pectinesterase, catalytic [Tanacetum cinerariifolium]
MTIAATLDEAIFVRKKTKRIEDMTRPGIEKETWHSCVSDCDEAIVGFNATLLDRHYKALEYSVAATLILMCQDTFDMRNITSIFPLVIADLEPLMENAIQEARMVLKRAQEIESTYPNVPGKSSWDSCVDYFNGIVYTLNMVLDQTLKPTPLETQTWISGGLTYINVCEKGFEMINVANTIVPVISNKLKELILNSLAISVAIRDANTNTNTHGHGITDWNFNDEYNLSNLALERPDVVVAKDGSGNYETIQEAVNSAGKGRQGKRYVIYVKAGVYEENVKILHQMEYIEMYGDGIHKTIVTGDRTFGRYGDLKKTATF